MNLRVRDHLLYWSHLGFHKLGKIEAVPLAQIKKEGFKKVLIVATTAIGDAVLCTPLMDSLKAARPDLEIGLWVSRASAPLFQGRQGISEVVPYYGKYRQVQTTLKALKQGGYDLALVANANDPDIIPMIWWSGCRRIIRRPQRNTLYKFMIANPEMLSPNHTTGHAIDRNLEFCDLLGIARGDVRTRLEVTPKVQQEIQHWSKDWVQPLWFMHPGASQDRKQWEATKFAELGNRILKEVPGTLVLTGSTEEADLCRMIEMEINQPARVKNLAGRLTLDELAALFKVGQLLISGDTGPYHIAMAVGTPTVTLFAPWDAGSTPAINGPYFNHDLHLVVEAEMKQPISTLSTETVFQSCKPLLDAKKSRGA